MDEKKRNEIKDIVATFRGKPVNNEVLKSFCERKGYALLVESEYSLSLLQVEHDEMMATAYPLLFAELSKLPYLPLYSTDSEQKKADEETEKILESMVKIMGTLPLGFVMTEHAFKEVANTIMRIFEQLGTRLHNDGLYKVLLPLAKERFGSDFNTLHAAKYLAGEAGKK